LKYLHVNLIFTALCAKRQGLPKFKRALWGDKPEGLLPENCPNFFFFFCLGRVILIMTSPDKVVILIMTSPDKVVILIMTTPDKVVILIMTTPDKVVVLIMTSLDKVVILIMTKLKSRRQAPTKSLF
jgi:hypothetical protein